MIIKKEKKEKKKVKKEKEKGLTNKIKKKRKGERIFETLSKTEKKKPIINKRKFGRGRGSFLNSL